MDRDGSGSHGATWVLARAFAGLEPLLTALFTTSANVYTGVRSPILGDGGGRQVHQADSPSDLLGLKLRRRHATSLGPSSVLSGGTKPGHGRSHVRGRVAPARTGNRAQVRA